MQRTFQLIFILCAVLSLVLVSVDYSYGHRAERPFADSSCLLCKAFSSLQMQYSQPLILHLPGIVIFLWMLTGESARVSQLCVLSIIAPRPPPQIKTALQEQLPIK